MAFKLISRDNPGGSIDPLGVTMHNAALLPQIGDELGYTTDDGQDVYARVVSRRFYFRENDPRVELIVESLSPDRHVRPVGYGGSSV